MEERSPVPETWYLLLQLVPVVVVGMDVFFRVLKKPVDESVLPEGESARQDASFSPNTDDRIWKETRSPFRLMVTQQECQQAGFPGFQLDSSSSFSFICSRFCLFYSWTKVHFYFLKPRFSSGEGRDDPGAEAPAVAGSTSFNLQPLVTADLQPIYSFI